MYVRLVDLRHIRATETLVKISIFITRQTVLRKNNLGFSLNKSHVSLRYHHEMMKYPKSILTF